MMDLQACEEALKGLMKDDTEEVEVAVAIHNYGETLLIHYTETLVKQADVTRALEEEDLEQAKELMTILQNDIVSHY